MWFCSDCDDYFEEPRTVTEIHSELGEEAEHFPEEYSVCPYCGGEYIEEAFICGRCGEPSHEGETFCPDCTSAILASFAKWLDNEAWEIAGESDNARERIKDVLVESGAI